MNTIYSKFNAVANKNLDKEAVAEIAGGQYVSLNYRDLLDKVDKLGSFLSKSYSERAAIAILLPNGPNWYCVDLAAARAGLTIVPIHTTFNSENVKHILKDANVSCLVVTEELFTKHKDVIHAANLQTCIVSDSDIEGCEKLSDIIDSQNEVTEPQDISSGAIHSIVYTSGTTGKPKGVMLTHKNFISNVSGATSVITIKPEDRFFSFLPLSHIFERTAGYYVPLFSGASIYFAQNSKTIIDDIKLAKPTVVVSVPRIFERVHEKIEAKIQRSALKKRLFDHALKLSGEKNLGTLSLVEKSALVLYKKILFKKIIDVFGGRLRFAVSGGASLAKHIAEFFYATGILVVEGYGLTETGPIITMNSLSDFRFGSVGKTLPGVEVKIGQDDEILVKSPGLMKGYNNDTTGTNEVIDSDGWFHTGDIGELKDGFLSITGRKKEIIVLSTGKNVFPVPIEQALEESRYIKQAFVYGDGHKFLKALLVLETDMVSSESGVIQKEIDERLKEFEIHEKIGEFKIYDGEFSVENGMLTPTMKIRRKKILKMIDHD